MPGGMTERRRCCCWAGTGTCGPATWLPCRSSIRAFSFSWKTVHGSKGLEADYVVVLGLCPGSTAFPPRSPTTRCSIWCWRHREAHPNAEERRLLYVALTRARRQVFLLADGGPPSTS